MVHAQISIFAVLAACWSTPTPPRPKPPVPVAHDARLDRAAATAAAEKRAGEIIDAQIDAAWEAGGDEAAEAARDRAVQSVFAPDAVIVTENGMVPVDKIHARVFWNLGIDKVVAGGTADVIWFVATFNDLAHRTPSAPGLWYPVRYTGIVARSRSSWKIVAASILEELGEVHHQTAGAAVPSASSPGPLTRVILDGAALASRLPPDAMVVGPGEHDVARGAGALGPWASRTLVLDTAAGAATRELAGDTWTTLQANVSFPDGDVSVLALAVRSGTTLVPLFVQYIGR
jgi:hypothetical protein